ncbi:translation factor [Amniculicola lignicola CBS 123094]|uniref:Threonylcarbamoyl-AMP synthase n=1 Tax=Amniculicola lignicola CBS 123094 TaxID=1392246 RepID=A0A6A5X4J5_9PLEO|nr:translation factor [Amniculicola lignicola CBS 123094]
MPIRPIIPNVTSKKLFSTFACARQTLASTEIPSSPSSLKSIPPYISKYKRDIPSVKKKMDKMETQIFAVNPKGLGKIVMTGDEHGPNRPLRDVWDIEYSEEGEDYKILERAAKELRETNTPVAFPTETVYGLGADATRSEAVKAIFAAKGRPADNPLIVHVHSFSQLRQLLLGPSSTRLEVKEELSEDPIPTIYHVLLRKFWPGPLTIILPNPEKTYLAPEVTTGLSTFGARMPRSLLALSLIRLSGVPLAAPSANASTRPSPTAAEHVYDDLHGRIRTIIDGGPCEVGVESTVVDGLGDLPVILRPGGVTVEMLRGCAGWENVKIGYKDGQEVGGRPRAPGMKYRHYSPKARVVLYEAGVEAPTLEEVGSQGKMVGVIRTGTWTAGFASSTDFDASGETAARKETTNGISHTPPSTSPSSDLESNLLRSFTQHDIPHASLLTVSDVSIWDINLGASTSDVARGLFSALRELDKKGVEVIYVEGIDDKVGDDIAAAVMNRLRKAAEIKI